MVWHDAFFLKKNIFLLFINPLHYLHLLGCSSSKFTAWSTEIRKLFFLFIVTAGLDSCREAHNLLAEVCTVCVGQFSQVS